jgi:hypothetical protein
MNWLMLFGEIIAAHYENNMKPTNTLCGQNTELQTVKAVPLGFKGLTRPCSLSDIFVPTHGTPHRPDEPVLSPRVVSLMNRGNRRVDREKYSSYF